MGITSSLHVACKCRATIHSPGQPRPCGRACRAKCPSPLSVFRGGRHVRLPNRRRRQNRHRRAAEDRQAQAPVERMIVHRDAACRSTQPLLLAGRVRPQRHAAVDAWQPGGRGYNGAVGTSREWKVFGNSVAKRRLNRRVHGVNQRQPQRGGPLCPRAHGIEVGADDALDEGRLVGTWMDGYGKSWVGLATQGSA
jgi:hypothetical protein